jgi:hypothetical protein
MARRAWAVQSGAAWTSPRGLTMAGAEAVVVKSFGTVRGVPILEAQLDALGAASRLPSFFSSRGFLEALLDHDERRVPGDEVVLLAALEGDRLAGFLPLRRIPERTSRGRSSSCW